MIQWVRMKVVALSLKQFRSYADRTFRFSPTVTLITGANTSGKTNILEALYCLAVGRSFRAEKESDMIRMDEEVGRIAVTIPSEQDSSSAKHPDDADTQLEVVMTTGTVQGSRAPLRKYLVNGVSRRQIDFVGKLRVVLFSPADLELITDSPSLRRQYLNSVLVQTDREYRRTLLSYERGLRQRNKLLDLLRDGKANRSQLLFWDQLLIQAGSYITKKRGEFVEFVNSTVLDGFSFRLVYDASIISRARLDQYRYEEVAAATTLVGPQRDEFVFEQRKEEGYPWRNVHRFGSRGEQRLAVLWVKLAERSYIQSSVQDEPILLLDDIFSELDTESRDIVLSVVGAQQTIITSAEDVASLFPEECGLEIISLPPPN